MDALLARLMDAQNVWARPLGGFIQGIVKAIFRPIRPVKDFLNGTWLGHSVHVALTDLPVGIFTLTIVFDVLGLADAARLSLAIGLLAMLATAVAGYADYTDTDGKARHRATLHQILMLVALVAYVIALVPRLGSDGIPPLGFAFSIVGYLLLISGAYVGGDVVYAMGNMVSRHAWRPGGAKWAAVRIDGEVKEGALTTGTLGTQKLLLTKQGDTIRALHDTCAHAGAPLHEGRIVDGCIECPWHQSRYRLRDGRHVQGPTTFDQPLYEVRVTDTGAWEARRVK
jgi:nitrite reductase/ring-hydroxylating ferredoxin subunit/uncharacterized membrane protein